MTSKSNQKLISRILKVPDDELRQSVNKSDQFGFFPSDREVLHDNFEDLKAIWYGIRITSDTYDDGETVACLARCMRTKSKSEGLTGSDEPGFERDDIVRIVSFLRRENRIGDKNGVERHDSGALQDRTQNLTAHFKALLDEVLTPSGQSELRKIAAGFQNGRPEDLRQFLEVMPRVTADLEARGTDPIEEATVKALPSVNPNVPTPQELAQFTPTKFFAWFEQNWGDLAHNDVSDRIQRWLKSQNGKSYGAFDDNSLMVKGLRQVLNQTGLLIACPGSIRSGPCGEPSRPVFVRDRNDPSSSGLFRFKHVGKQQFQHGAYRTFPDVTLCSRAQENPERAQEK